MDVPANMVAEILGGEIPEKPAFTLSPDARTLLP